MNSEIQMNGNAEITEVAPGARFHRRLSSLAALACALVLLAGSVAHSAGVDQPRYLLPATAFAKLPAATLNEMTAAMCEGKADGTTCDTCPESDAAGAGFSLANVVLGHFLGPSSDDALVTVYGCEQMHASVGWGFLLSRREGKWESLEDALGLALDYCHRMRYRDGSELLVCEDHRMESFEWMHRVTAISAKDDSIEFENLLTAADTTGYCGEQTRPQKAQLERIEFRDLNGDGREDVSITASFRTLPESKRRQDLCDAAQDGKAGARTPQPKALKTYRIDYLFDGERFTLTKTSEAAAALFHWEN